MRSDFEGFFDYKTKTPNLGGMTMYRSKHHSFWHDDPDDAGMRERYTRRIQRFQAIDASTEPVLFVRAMASTDELALAGELSKELTERFGEKAHLLLIVDFQTRAQGPAIVRGLLGNVLLYYHRCEDREPSFAPYMKPITTALHWAAGKPINAMEMGSMAEATRVIEKTDWGFNAHGNVRSFEEEAAHVPPATQSMPAMQTAHGLQAMTSRTPLPGCGPARSAGTPESLHRVPRSARVA